MPLMHNYVFGGLSLLNSSGAYRKANCAGVDGSTRAILNFYFVFLLTTVLILL